MRTISKEELEQILENHKEWIRDDRFESDEKYADLRDTDLCGAILRNVDLREANLRRTNLKGADLSESDFSRADLSDADLSDADLSETCLSEARLGGANLRKANLREANLYSAHLHKANLIGADLSGARLCRAGLMGAILSGANLFGANLHCANLIGADLRGAELFGADLTGADLSKAILPNPEVMNSICPLNCPETGAFIGWKKAYAIERVYPSKVQKNVEVIVKLQIPGRAKRSSATSRKCRCDRALVLDIQSLGGESLPTGTVAYSRYDHTFTYEAGQKLYIANFDDDRWKECSAGIHFFITRQEAVDY